jgi:hypothetical protein
MIKSVMFILSLLVLFSNPKKPPQTSPEGLWRLLTITYQANREVRDYTNFMHGRMPDGKKRKILFIDIDKTHFSYSLDINTCGMMYELLPNQKISLYTNPGRNFCTRACCDNPELIKILDYQAVEQYIIQTDTLWLISPRQTFKFLKTQDMMEIEELEYQN